MTKRKDPKDYLKVGRPTVFRQEMIQEAADLTLIGHTNEDLAKEFGVDEVTIQAWIREKPDFSQAIKNSKAKYDAAIARAISRRIIGGTQTVRTTKRRDIDADGNPIEVTETITELAPDVGNGMKWLKARQPKQFAENNTLNINIDLFGSLLDAASDNSEILDADFEELSSERID